MKGRRREDTSGNGRLSKGAKVIIDVIVLLTPLRRKNYIDGDNSQRLLAKVLKGAGGKNEEINGSQINGRVNDGLFVASTAEAD